MVGLPIRQLTRVAVGVSGGVDSAVAALLLKNKGYDVHGVFMRNWDELDETGICRLDSECAAAEWVCRKIAIPFTEMNFVQQYWNDVFQSFLQEYQQGLTPNPDILCNRHIKFGALAEACQQQLGAEYLATGHYARLTHDGRGGVRLLRAIDESKDQTFFLSQVEQRALRRTMFPVGGLLKTEVRAMAAAAGLTRVADKKDSTGICFIGNRNFKSFIAQYVTDKPGHFVDIDSGEVVGHHNGQHQWTLGQCCRLPTAALAKYYVAEKMRDSSDILVCGGRHHPALYSTALFTAAPHWITPSSSQCLVDGGKMRGHFRFLHRQPLVNCEVRLMTDEETTLCDRENQASEQRGLAITLEKPIQAITPGQFAVLYRGEQCLGSASIASPGPSLYSLNSSGCRDAVMQQRRILPTLLCTALAAIIKEKLASMSDEEQGGREIASVAGGGKVFSTRVGEQRQEYWRRVREAKALLDELTRSGDYIHKMEKPAEIDTNNRKEVAV